MHNAASSHGPVDGGQGAEKIANARLLRLATLRHHLRSLSPRPQAKHGLYASWDNLRALTLVSWKQTVSLLKPRRQCNLLLTVFVKYSGLPRYLRRPVISMVASRMTNTQPLKMLA